MNSFKSMKIKEWNEAYNQKQNFIYYPKDEVIIFLNKYIKKRTGLKSFENILKTNDNIINGLDFGCGIGRATIFMKEFNRRTCQKYFMD